MQRRFLSPLRPALALAFPLALGFAACTDDDTGDKSVTCAAPGAPIPGPADTHCGDDVVTVDPAQCDAEPPTEPMEEEAATLNGTEGDDDDCKYHVSYTSTQLCENGDVYFTVTLRTKATPATAVTGASPNIEGFLTATPTHVLPNSGQKSQELNGGQYKIGPVHFDAKGAWTLRFHFFEECTDTEASPHGHVAFGVTLP